MRKLVPFLSLLVLIVLWSFYVHADECSQDQISAEACNAQADSRLKDATCTAAQSTVQNGTPSSFSSQGLDADGIYNGAKDQIDRWNNNLGTPCSMPSDITNAPAAPPNASKDSSLYVSSTSSVANKAAQLSGKCYAMNAICKCIAKNVTPTSDGKDKNTLCNAFDGSKQADRARVFLTASDQVANKVQPAVDSSNPATVTATLTQNPTGGGTGSGMGSMLNSALGAAMPGLMMAMRQAMTPPPPPQIPNQPDAMPACTGSGGGGTICGQLPVATVQTSPWANHPANGSFASNPTGSGSFNTDSVNNGVSGAPPVLPAVPDATTPPLQVAQIPVGGTAMPGANSSPTTATLGGGSTGGGGGAVGPSKVADILSGTTSHSAYAQARAGMDMSTNGGGGFGGYTAPAMEHLNLAEFLPGGKNDPVKRGLAGASEPRVVQIQSREVNIWSRISDHIRMRCTQGLLRDCVP